MESALCHLKDLEDLEIIELKQFNNPERDRPAFENRIFKMLYFFLREGVISTLKKYFAHKQEQMRYLTFLFVRYHQKKYLNISIQSQTEASDFVVRNSFYEWTGSEFLFPEPILEDHFIKFNQFSKEGAYEEFGIDTSHPVSFNVTPPAFQDHYESGLFIFGLGGYIRMFVIQHFKRMQKIACIDFKALVSRDFKKRYGFKYDFVLPGKSLPLLMNVKAPVAIVSTYHSDHASLASEIYKSNPQTFIFIEKPPVVTLDDLDKLVELYNRGARIEMGFNRRFIGYSKYVKEKIEGKRAIITCSIKEVNINPNHWYFWDNQGTRITGNVVHWFDLATFWIQSIPVEINLIASPLDQESSAISVIYKNGSILNITASDKGNSLRGVQEKIEVRFDNETIHINDFTVLTHLKSNGIKHTKRKFRRKKGHHTMYKNFLQIINHKRSSDYTVSDLINTSLVTIYASQMLKENTRNLKIDNKVMEYLEKVRN